MVQGMILPISIKAIEGLTASFRSHRLPGVVLVEFITGYFLFPIVSGVVLHCIGYGIDVFANHTGVLLFDGWKVGAAVFGVAGLFQFSAVKTNLTRRSCSIDCTALRAREGLRKLLGESVKSGLQHGFFCFMCCWVLTCLMFVFWTGILFGCCALAR